VMNASFTMFDRLIYCSDSWGNQPVDHAGSNLCFTFDQNNDDDIAQIELLFAKAVELGCERLKRLNGPSDSGCSVILLV